MLLLVLYLKVSIFLLYFLLFFFAISKPPSSRQMSADKRERFFSEIFELVEINRERKFGPRSHVNQFLLEFSKRLVGPSPDGDDEYSLLPLQNLSLFAGYSYVVGIAVGEYNQHIRDMWTIAV